MFLIDLFLHWFWLVWLWLPLRKEIIYLKVLFTSIEINVKVNWSSSVFNLALTVLVRLNLDWRKSCEIEFTSEMSFFMRETLALLFIWRKCDKNLI